MAERAMYKEQGESSTLAPVPTPTLAPTMANVASTVASTSRQATAGGTSSTDRWGRLWKVKEARAAEVVLMKRREGERFGSLGGEVCQGMLGR